MPLSLNTLSPRRRVLVLTLVLVVVVVVAGGLTAVVLSLGSGRGVPAQDQAGPVLLVPGYGGNTGSLEGLPASGPPGARRRWCP